MFVQLTESLSQFARLRFENCCSLFVSAPACPSVSPHFASLRLDSSCLGSARRLKSVADEAGSKFGRQTNRQAGRRAKSE